ncbi:PQQ-binding-like beta-propeller repeat protein [Candidatus Latescibacterota bacterium]
MFKKSIYLTHKFWLVFIVVISFILISFRTSQTSVLAQNRLKWIFRDIGNEFPISIKIEKQSGESYIKEYLIDVLDVDINESNYLLPAIANKPYEYQFPKNDFDVKFEIFNGPEWLGINSTSGLLHGNPAEDDVGINSIIVLVTDESGIINEKSTEIKVVSTENPDTIYLSPAIVDIVYNYQLPQENPDDRFEILEGPVWLYIDKNTGLLRGYPSEIKHFSSPIVSQDGTIYVKGGDLGNEILYAISPNGTELWRYNPYRGIYGLALGKDGTIYINDEIGYLYALDPDGPYVKWSYLAEDGGREIFPAIGIDGTIYYGSHDGYLVAVNPDGKLIWKCLLATELYRGYHNIQSSPAIGPDGTIYVGCKEGKLYAVTPWGTIKWRSMVDRRFVIGSPSIGNDRKIYAAPHGYRVYEFNPDGTINWINTEINNPGDSSPVIAADGTIYVGSDEGTEGCSLYALDKAGNIKWNYPMGKYITTALIGTGGIVYYVGYNKGENSSVLYALNPDGTVNWKYEITNLYSYSFAYSTALSSDGTLYLGHEFGLYAFQTDSHGYQENSPWPTFMHNNTRCVTDDSFKMPELYTISGQISKPDTLVKKGIPVLISSLITETLDDGSFSFKLPDGEYLLEIYTDTIFNPRLINFEVNGKDVVLDVDDNTNTSIGKVFEFSLNQIYPNPFNSYANITYSIPKNSQVTLSIYNISGQRVSVLKDGYQPAGNYSATWDAAGMPSGLYFCILQANGLIQTRKMLLLK